MVAAEIGHQIELTHGRGVAVTVGTPVEMPDDVVQRLEAVAPDLGGRQMLLVPTRTRAGQTWYTRDDAGLKSEARIGDLDADFLVPATERRYLDEFSAFDLTQFAIAVGENLTAATIGGILGYARGRLRHRHAPNTPGPTVAPSITVIRRTTRGIESVQVEAVTDSELLDNIRKLLEDWAQDAGQE
jgi:hypothetical protein